MNTIFADTLYWVALINPQDQWRARSICRPLAWSGVAVDD